MDPDMNSTARRAIYLMIFLITSTLSNAASLHTTVDLLRPVDPDARSGEKADDYEAAKKIVFSAIDAYARDSTEENLDKLVEEMELLGELGGYTLVSDSNRSARQYREVMEFLESLRDEEPFTQEIRPFVPVPEHFMISELILMELVKKHPPWLKLVL